jgi:UTP:GlnB (protein PII) uridylyltransferase
VDHYSSSGYTNLDDLPKRSTTKISRATSRRSGHSCPHAVNLPQVQLPERPNGTRFIHVHENRPGMLIQLNEIFSSRGLNIVAEFLQTLGDTGYVVVEADGISENADEILQALREIPGRYECD